MAQFGEGEKNQSDHDAKPYYFGITIGINLARFQTELHPRFLQYDSVYVAEPTNSGGFTLGLSANARLSDRFQLRFNPQLMFIERNIYYKLKYPDIDGHLDVTKKVESVIMTFPFQIKFQSDRIGNFRVYALAGLKPILTWPPMPVQKERMNWSRSKNMIMVLSSVSASISFLTVLFFLPR